jgi:hypothetical protein
LPKQPSSANADVVIDQVAAGIAQAFKTFREKNLGLALDEQVKAFIEAMNEYDNVIGYLSDPSGQLGNPSTKHGEIAEVVDIGIRRARDYIENVALSATDEGVARTGPVDFILNGVDAQSKFINGVSQGLYKVVGHLEKYPSFAQDGVYVIPSDQYALIEKVLNGDTADMSARTVKAVQARLQEISDATGRPPLDVLKPSVSTYADVQPGKVESTMDNHHDDLEKRNDQRNQDINDAHQASFAEGAKATASAAAVGAAVSFASAAFAKYKQGKNLFRGDLTAQDWRDVGGDAALGALGGALSGAAVYAMTNCADLSAPLAGAFVSAVRGMRPLVASYSRGEITGAQLVDAGLFVCSDVAMVGVCTAVGQALIPVPVLGALVGSVAGKVLSSVLEHQLRGAAKAINRRLEQYLKNLDGAQRKLVTKVLAQYDALGQLAQRAFDLNENTALLRLSAELADAHGVPAHLVLRKIDDVDGFMLS